MAHIVLLAMAAAVFPTLIACVAIMISRPEPRRLLLAFYMGGVLASVGAGIVVLNAFKRGDSVVGNSSSNPNPGTSIVAGLLALALGWHMVSDRGRALVSRWRTRHPRPQAKNEGPSWAERRLDQANAAVAFAIGAAINLPGPFYVLALGEIAAGAYGRTAEFLGAPGVGPTAVTESPHGAGLAASGCRRPSRSESRSGQARHPVGAMR